MQEFLAVFRSRGQALDCAARLRQGGIPAVAVSTPQETGAGCGLSVRIGAFDFARVRRVFRVLPARARLRPHLSDARRLIPPSLLFFLNLSRAAPPVRRSFCPAAPPACGRGGGCKNPCIRAQFMVK